MGQRKASLLVVEDDDTLAATMALALIENGYRVLGLAQSVPEALKILEGAAPDLALIDVRLGDSTSEPLLPILDERKVRVCVVTGTLRHELPTPFLNYPVLQKPFGQSELIEEVDKALFATDG